jgi:DNA-binding LacI/PurR family transcriptional regulator
MITVSKKQQIEKYLRAELQRGRWAVGEQMPIEDDLLLELGVSRSTVREALNSLISEGLMVRKQGIGTFVERVSQSAIVVCAWFENIVSPAGYWYRNLVSGIRGLVESENHGFDILVGNGDSIDAAVLSVGKHLSGPASKEFVGAINLMPSGNLENHFSRLGIPVVNIQIGSPMGKYSLVLDYAQMMEKAAEIMDDYGLADFAVMYTDDPPERVGLSTCAERDEWLKALVSGDKSRLVPVASIPDAYVGFKRWWANRQTKGIFFMDDSLYEVAARAILELEIRVPTDLRIVTHANAGRQFSIPFPIDRVGFDGRVVVGTAWEMLNNLIIGERVVSDVVHISGVCQRCEHLELRPPVFNN